VERSACLSDVPVTALAPGRLGDVLPAEGLARFERTIAQGRELLGESTLWTVNSTASGGGVAEMLRSLIGYVRGAGLDARWIVIGADADFFRITKRLHNRLHGASGAGELGAPERALYERHTSAS
jgi:trehalose synthase